MPNEHKWSHMSRELAFEDIAASIDLKYWHDGEANSSTTIYKQEVAQAQSVSLKPLQPNQLCRALMLGKSTNKPQPQFANWCWKLSNHLKSLEPFVKWTPLCTWLVVRDSNMRQCQLPWALGCTAVNISSSASYYSISHLRNSKNIEQHVTAKSLKVAGKPP